MYTVKLVTKRGATTIIVSVEIGTLAEATNYIYNNIATQDETTTATISYKEVKSII